MQAVNEKFYIWYNRVAMLYGGVVAIITCLSFAIPSMAVLHERWGFIPFIAVIGVIQVLYGLFVFKRTPNYWIGGLSGAMIVSIINLGIMHNSGQLHSWFLIVWFLQVLAGGMYGLYSLIGCAFITTVYYLLTATGVYGRQLIDPVAIGAVLGSYVVIMISYAIWRKLYQATESIKINQLTGQLQSKQLQTEVLIQSISDGMIVVDTEGKISLVNPAAAKMTGWPIEEALGLNIEVVAKFAQEDGKEIDDAEHPFKKILKDGLAAESTLQLIDRSSKTPHVVSLVISPIMLADGKESAGAVAVMRDVSAAREEEHRRADFISTASHEMRTPVAAIEGYLQLALNEKVAKIDPKARDYLTKSLESTHRLGTLFQDLLTSAKAEDGRLVSHPRVVEMGEYLETITEGLKFAAEKKGMLVDFVIGNDQQNANKMVKPLYYALIDPDRMQEVITNLFDNAVKYSENGKISIALTGNDQVVQFFVRDTGHGIPADDVPHLFQKFYRVDNSSTRTIGGTGLGLFICRKIVELYNGRIWVESEVGKGSTFYINMPRLSTQKATELQTKEQQQVV